MNVKPLSECWTHGPSMKRISTIGTLCAALLFASPTFASDLQVGARLVGGFNQLAGPNDPVGEPTLLSGAAFSGLGFGGGAAAVVALSQTSVGTLYLETNFLYVAHSATGTAKAASGNQSRTVELSANTLHIPLLIGVRSVKGSTGYRLALGPEVLMGLGSAAAVTEEGLSGSPQPLYTTPVTHVGLTATLGFDFEINPSLVVPVDLRATWDFSIPATTRDRFDNYRDAANPGSYQVAYTWFFSVVMGVDYVMNTAK